MRRIGQVLGLLSAVAIISGCATSANDYYNEYWTKSEPSSQVEYVKEKKDWYGNNYRLAYHTDLALAYLHSNNLKKASEEFRFADDVIDENFKNDYPGLVMAFSVSEESTEYAGDPYEQVQIPMLRSLVLAQQKNWEPARAMARRTNDQIQAVVQKVVKKHGFDSVSMNTQNSENHEKKPEIKWHYIKDAFALYIAAAAAYNERDYENALASARNALETYKSYTYQNNYLVKKVPDPALRLYCHLAKTIDSGAIRSMDKKLVADNCSGVANFDVNKGEANIVILHGRAATKQSLNVDIRMDDRMVFRLVMGAAVPLFRAFMGMNHEDSYGKTASRNVSAGKSSVIYDILLGLILSDPYIAAQILFQVAELERKGAKNLGSGITNAIGVLSTNVMRVSVPIYLWYPTMVIPNQVRVGNNELSQMYLGSNLDGIRDRELFDNMTMAMVRSLSRGFFRLALAEGAGKVGQETGGKTAGLVAKLAVGAVTKAAETSETRSLRSLPQAIYLTGASVTPGEYPLSGSNLKFTSDKITVEPNKISFVIAFSGN